MTRPPPIALHTYTRRPYTTLLRTLGCPGSGGVTNGIYTTDSVKQVEYIVNDSRTMIYVAENDEQLDKILEVRDRCPSLRKIVVMDMEGLADFSDRSEEHTSELNSIMRIQYACLC